MLRRVFRLHASGRVHIPLLSAFTEDMLSPSNVAVDSPLNPSLVTITQRHSKADPFGRGVTIYLGRTVQVICPVAATLNYLVRRGQFPGPLFLFQDGSALSKERLIASIHQILMSQGYSSAGITGHSFHIGAATAAARAGLGSIIQTLGRWHSQAYMRYICIYRAISLQPRPVTSLAAVHHPCLIDSLLLTTVFSVLYSYPQFASHYFVTLILVSFRLIR